MCSSDVCPNNRKCQDCGEYVCKACCDAVFAADRERWAAVLERLKDK